MSDDYDTWASQQYEKHVSDQCIAVLKEEVARLKAELAAIKARRCGTCKWRVPALFHKDTGDADYGSCEAWEDVDAPLLTERSGFCHRWQPKEAADG